MPRLCHAVKLISCPVQCPTISASTIVYPPPPPPKRHPNRSGFQTAIATVGCCIKNNPSLPLMCPVSRLCCTVPIRHARHSPCVHARSCRAPHSRCVHARCPSCPVAPLIEPCCCALACWCHSVVPCGVVLSISHSLLLVDCGP